MVGRGALSAYVTLRSVRVGMDRTVRVTIAQIDAALTASARTTVWISRGDGPIVFGRSNPRTDVLDLGMVATSLDHKRIASR